MGVNFSDLKDNFRVPIKRPDSSWATGGEPGGYDTETIELASNEYGQLKEASNDIINLHWYIQQLKHDRDNIRLKGTIDRDSQMLLEDNNVTTSIERTSQGFITELRLTSEMQELKDSEPNFITIQEKAEPEKHDSHYKNLSIEPNDLIDELSLHLNRRLIWPVGNVLKYSMRAPFKHKDELADLEKAYNYLGLAIEKLKEELDNE